MAGLGRPGLGLLRRSRLEFVAELGTSFGNVWRDGIEISNTAFIVHGPGIEVGTRQTNVSFLPLGRISDSCKN